MSTLTITALVLAVVGIVYALWDIKAEKDLDPQRCEEFKKLK